MRPPHSRLTVRSPVKPYRKDWGLSAPPSPTSDPDRPLGDEVLEHLEEWGYRDAGDSFGDLTLPDEMLRRFEEATSLDEGDHVECTTNRERPIERPAAPVPTALDREHPLWDRELDG